MTEENTGYGTCSKDYNRNRFFDISLACIKFEMQNTLNTKRPQTKEG